MDPNLTVGLVAANILDFAGQLLPQPTPEAQASGFAMHMALLNKNPGRTLTQDKVVEFLIIVENGDVGRVKTALAGTFPARFRLTAAGLFYVNQPEELEDSEDRESSEDAEIIEGAEVQSPPGVEIRLFCAHWYGCQPSNIPLLHHAAGNIVRQAALPDLIIFNMHRLIHAELEQKPRIVTYIKRLVLRDGTHGRLGLTAEQKRMVASFLPDLCERDYGWPRFVWRQSLALGGLE